MGQHPWNPDGKPLSFALWETYLDSNPRRQWLCRNTRAYRFHHDIIEIIYYATPVVTYYRNGTIDLSTGHWWTNSTFDRLRRFSPFIFYRHQRDWYFYLGKHWGRPGMVEDRWTFPFEHSAIRVFPDRRRNPVARLSEQRIPSLQAVKTARAKRKAREQQARRYGQWLIRHQYVGLALHDWLQRYITRNLPNPEEVRQEFVERDMVLPSLEPPKEPFRRVIDLG